MKRAIFLPTLAMLTALLLSACRVVQPLATPRASSAERTTVALCGELRDLIWCWDSPDGKMPPITREERVTLADFRPRFHRFCADTGIVAAGEPPLVLAGDLPSPAVELTTGSRAWKRILELTYVFGGTFSRREAVVDLLVLEVPGDLARQWGLDGFPAAGKPPARFADGIPSLFEEEEFVALRSAILKRRGTRIHAAASMVTPRGETTQARAVNEVFPLSAVSLSPVDHITEPATKAKSEKPRSRAVGRAVPMVAYGTDSCRDLGVVLRAMAVPPWDNDGQCFVEAEIDIDGVDSWTVYNAKEHIRTPLISSFSLSTGVECRMGQTALVGRAFQTGQARTALNGKPPRRSCLLAFLTPRWLTVPARWPAKEDFVSPAGQLLVASIGPHMVGLGKDYRGKIDWERDDSGAPSRQDGSPTRKMREFLAQFGVARNPGTKIFYSGCSLVFFGSLDEVQEMDDLFVRGSCYPPSLTISRVAAIRITPELWLKLTADRHKEYGESDRILNREEARRFLRRVAQDRESEILSATALLSQAGRGTATLYDVAELTAPVGWERHLLANRSVWLPKWDDGYRAVGSVHRADVVVRAHGGPVVLDMEPEYTEFARWVPCGPTLGLPQYRSHRLNAKVELERDTYLLLGGAGAGTDESPFVVWLVGADGVNW